jgi:hypothetical protein
VRHAAAARDLAGSVKVIAGNRTPVSFRRNRSRRPLARLAADASAARRADSGHEAASGGAFGWSAGK